MAQPIQVPQTTPNAPQFQPPTDLVNAYLQRETEAPRYMAESINNMGNIINRYHQQKIQNQLAALGAVSQLYGAGGPRAVQQYAPSINQASGTNIIPTQPPPQGTPQNATLPPNQDQSPSPYIQASLQMGHPDVAGVGTFHAPQPSPADIQDIQSGGTYGRNKAQSFKDLGDLSMQPITAAQKQQEMVKTGNDIAMQPTEAELKKQQLINAQQQIPMEVKKTISGEVSKQSQDTQNITQLKTLAGNLDTALKGHDSGVLGNQAGTLYQVSGGRIGSKTAAAIQNAANPLATALNTELARRFNSGEVALLSQSLIPQPKDTPEYAQQKLQNLNRLIDSMASGNETNVKNVAAAITSGSIPSISAKAQPQGNVPVISSDAAFKALPSGATFKDPSGQVHRKK
jgi:hypothetical protein